MQMEKGDRNGPVPAQELDGSRYGLFSLAHRTDVKGCITARFHEQGGTTIWEMNQELSGSTAADMIVRKDDKILATFFVIPFKDLVTAEEYNSYPIAPQPSKKVQCIIAPSNKQSFCHGGVHIVHIHS